MRWLGQPIRILGHPVSLGAVLLMLGSIALLIPIWIHQVDTTERLKLDYGDIISICAFVSTVVIAVFSIIPNLRSMAESSRSQHYSELDGMYNHLLTLAVHNPRLRNPGDDPDDWGPEYEPYAYMVWNFLETIHDRCADDERLRGTWAPVIAAEHILHRRWFTRETVPYIRDGHHPKFCLEFCDFIWRSFWLLEGTPAARQWYRRNWTYRMETTILADPALRPYILPVSPKPEPIPAPVAPEVAAP